MSQDAEPTRPPSEEPTGRDRLLAALRKPGSRGQITAAILLAVVGFASVVQVRATEQDDQYAGARQEDLIQLLNSLAAASQRAENEIAQLEQTRSSLRNNTNSRQAALEQARQQANMLGILAGTLPAVGPGVQITVDDPTAAVGIDQLLNGLEELRDAGAEAIEINDTVRVVAQTALEDGDGGLVVGGQQVSPPYTIEAIGDPHTLAEALDFSGGFADQIERVGGTVVVEQVDNVEIATTMEPTPPEYAEPVETE
jgi:uncharacterized protein YlxW (UPF0749 family)